MRVAQHEAVPFQGNRQPVRRWASQPGGRDQLAERQRAGFQGIEYLDGFVKHPDSRMNLPVVHASSLGRAMAWEDSERLHQGLLHAKYTASRLAAVRKRGWAESINEREEGVCSISAPIRNASGQVIAAISISGPSGRMGSAPGRRYAPLVMTAVKYLTDALMKASVNR